MKDNEKKKALKQKEIRSSQKYIGFAKQKRGNTTNNTLKELNNYETN